MCIPFLLSIQLVCILYLFFSIDFNYGWPAEMGFAFLATCHIICIVVSIIFNDDDDDLTVTAVIAMTLSVLEDHSTIANHFQ